MLTDIRHGLGASCPEGSSTKYSGPLNPAGGDCRCSPGWIWLNGYCQSPQSAAQQAGVSLAEQAQAYPDSASYAAQGLTEFVKQYFKDTRHSVSCKLVYPDNVPGGPNYPTMMCSIDGGPYEHGAYAINLNPGTAINSAIQSKYGAGTQATIQAQNAEVKSIVDIFNDVANAARDALSGGGNGGNGSNNEQQDSGDSGNGPTDSGLDIFGQTVEIFGYAVPVVALVAAGGLLLWSKSS